MEEKKGNIIGKWIKDKAQQTYVKVTGGYDGCNFINSWSAGRKFAN
jgi:hypothetical protein